MKHLPFGSARRQQALEASARRAAKRVGLMACKSRRGYHPLENLGEFMLIEPSGNYPVAGFKFDMGVEDTLDYCKD